VELQKECSRIKGLIFMYLARPAFEGFGMKGEKAVRKGLRAYGRFRGALLREWHEDLGIPINMESLMRYWDSASARLSGVYAPDAIFTPYYVEHPATTCQLYDVWKEENWEHYGYIFCDEEHHEVCMAYHPKAIVKIHEHLCKSDPMCHFKWMMIPEVPEDQIDKSQYELLDKRARDNPLEDAVEVLRRTNRNTGLLYYFLADSLTTELGVQGKRIVESGLRKLGARLGMELTDKLEKAGEQITIKNAFDHSFIGLPYKYHWKMKITSHDDRLVAEVESCPYAELWIRLGNKQVGATYCQEIYKSMFDKITPQARFDIRECIMKGASKCAFDFGT